MKRALFRVAPVMIVALGLWVTATTFCPSFVGGTAYAGDRVELTVARERAASEGALAELSHAFRVVAEKIRPAVVSITTSGRIIRLFDADGEPMLGDEALEELRRRGLELDEESGVFRIPLWGVGSGMIVDAAGGLILTNNHVIDEAEEIFVQLGDGRRFPAEIVNTDPSSDMAVVRIEADGLREVVLGDSDQVQVGDFVLAFGSPLRYAQTMTHGIVSAVGRSAPQLNVPYQNFIQTDAAINQGNSGGPLVNLRGEVIGMNTAIATQTGYDVGIGFAIPSSRIEALLPRLKSGDKIIRGYLGVTMQDVHHWREDAMSLGWDEDRGVIIRRVLEGTPAGDVGLSPDDIILDIDGKPVNTGAELQDRIATTEPGTEIAVGIFRERTRKAIRVTVGRQPDNFIELSARGFSRPEEGKEGEAAEERDSEPKPARLGIEVRELNRSLRRRYGWSSAESGFVITNVEPGSLAERGGLVPGDIIQRVQGQRIVSGERLRAEIAEGLAGDAGVRLLVKNKKAGQRELLFKTP